MKITGTKWGMGGKTILYQTHNVEVSCGMRMQQETHIWLIRLLGRFVSRRILGERL